MSRKKKTVSHVSCFILDKSGSMSSLKNQVVSGFKEYLNTLQSKNVQGKFFLTLFDSESIERPYEGTNFKEVEPLNHDSYRPFGMTPLYDAVVSTIKRLEMVVGDMKDVAVSVVIMTDGLENDSKQYNQQDLQTLVRKLTGKGNWTFAYMGANQDAWATAQQFGIQHNNVMQWNSDIRGTQKAFRGLANASADYMAAMSVSASLGDELSTKDFFKEQK